MSEQITFKDLTPKKKLEHIWTYYRFLIIGVILGVAMLISLISSIIGNTRSVLDVIMVDSNANGSSDTTAFNDFLESCGIEPFEDAVTLYNNLIYFSEEEMALLDQATQGEASLTNYDTQQMLLALLTAGKSEIFFGKGDLFLSYADQGALLDLTTMLSPELLARYEEQLVYAEEDGVSYPCAVALKDNPWLVENGYYTECYFGILYLNDNPELAAQFAEFLLNQ